MRIIKTALVCHKLLVALDFAHIMEEGPDSPATD